ncbi:MAG: ketose-bisphosphate aldolase [Alphaproteobacteria bacterium]|nr:ketose-bisphosphate aldolase [Alphaproteobacteria bacterium]
MTYSDFGLVNTRDMFRDAIANRYAVGAFNFFNMESLRAIVTAARVIRSPVILAVSESALNYIGDGMLMAMIAGLELDIREMVALHLDHGHSFEVCARAVDVGFSSVMIDASAMSFDENATVSARVAEYAHRYNVSVEAEIGTIGGVEDENTKSDIELFTRPDDAVEFVRRTGVDSLAVAIGTAHGAYKRRADSVGLRFDILAELERRLPDMPLVLHGASSIPEKFIREINLNGGHLIGAGGISREQLARAATTNICKINVDSDSRLAFTATVRGELANNPGVFNPREYLGAAMGAVYENTMDEMINIMNSGNRVS